MNARSRQPACTSCATRPVAMRGVAVCFHCWPGGPVQPPPCLRCGSGRDYYTSGVCVRCHPAARPGVDSCLDCYAWGATRNTKWLCRGCLSWRRNNPAVGLCRSCARTAHLGRRGVCRLCHKQAGLVREDSAALDVVAASRHGQQLFLADLFQSHARGRRDDRDCSDTSLVEVTDQTGPRRLAVVPERPEQLMLLTMRRDLSAHGRTGLHLRADPTRAAALERSARDLARRRGWSTGQTESACFGLRIVLAIQDSTDAPIHASDVVLLRDIDLPTWTVLEVLSDLGLLIEDRTASIDTWFTRQIDGLPDVMSSELQTWFEVMKHGSPTTPRRRPRTETTINVQLRWALPTLQAWAADGHTSLREITREQVLDALPGSGNPRSTTGQGLKSIFRLLKGRKVLFTDPTSRIKTGQHEARQPLPVDLDLVRDALHSADPARAAVVALIAFHGLRAGQLQRLLLTDIRDGRLHAGGRTIVLADPVRERLSAYLDHRNQRWPDTTNPHLFVHYRTAGHSDTSVGHRWIRLLVGPGLTPAAIREDRILNEADVTSGDVRLLSDLFGLSVNAATRYAATLDHPDLINAGSPNRVPR